MTEPGIRQMDLAIGDVHKPAAEAPAPARRKRRATKLAAAGKKTAVRIRGELGQGGHIHVRSLSDDSTRSVEVLADGTYCLRNTHRITSGAKVSPAEAGVTLVGPATWKDGSPKSLVWIQVAETGSWKGHGSGPFEITSKTFSEIVTNFNDRGLPVQWDMEHASEQDPTQGSIPIHGVPAQGWIHRLDNRGPAGLWALTEWLEYARDGINAGQFGWCSPAIRFGCKDGVSGKPIGARLTSCAITGSPFLTGLAGLVAAKDGTRVAETSMADYQIKGGAKALVASLAEQKVLMAGQGAAAFAHKPHEYMPAVKRALGLHELSMPQQCCDQLEALRDQVEACGDAEGMHHGADLGAYTRPLRSLVDAQPGDTWDDVFDAVEGLIQAAIADHEAKFQAGESSAQPTAGLSLDEDSDGDMTMSDQATTVALTDAQSKAKTLETEKAALLTEKAALATQLKDASDKVAAAETRAAAAETVLKTIALKDGETAASAIARIVAENAALLADKAKREETDLVADVEIAFSTYKDKRNLTDTMKPHMLSHAKADRAGFNATYPFVAPDQRHLLRSTPAEIRPKADGEELSFTALIHKLMSDKGLSYSEANVEAAKQLKDRGQK